MLGRDLASRLGRSTEVHRRRYASARGHRREVVVAPVLTVVGDGLVGPERAQQRHRLRRAAVALGRPERLAGQLAGDDVDRQSPVEELLQVLRRSGEHRRIELAHPHRRQQPRRGERRRQRRRKGPRIHPRHERTRDQHVVEARSFRAGDDVAVVLERRSAGGIVDAEACRVTHTRRGEPCEFQVGHAGQCRAAPSGGAQHVRPRRAGQMRRLRAPRLRSTSPRTHRSATVGGGARAVRSRSRTGRGGRAS